MMVGAIELIGRQLCCSRERDRLSFSDHGVADILIAVVDGLKGFPEAINAVFPEAIVRTPAFAGAGPALSI